MSIGNGHFNLLARVLHWSMALMIIAMLFIGVTMVASLHLRPMLIDLHRPLGIAIRCWCCCACTTGCAIARRRCLPTCPPAGAGGQGLALDVVCADAGDAVDRLGDAVGRRLPDRAVGGLHLPPIVPHTPALYAALRNAHSLLAYVLFATVLMHVGAALFHLWVRRDGVFRAMARGKD